MRLCSFEWHRGWMVRNAGLWLQLWARGVKGLVKSLVPLCLCLA